MLASRWGQTGPRVVLVHGGAQGTTVGGERHFATQQRLAARGWQLCVPDRPGHGHSPTPPRPDDAEADGALLADELLEQPTHLVGHSFGACVALAAAVRRPESVRSLTLIEPGMMKLARHRMAVRLFGLQLLVAIRLNLSPVARARKFAELMRIPPEISGSRDLDEMRRVGRGIARLKVPSARRLRRQLRAVREAGIPLLVVTGGWNPAFEATADAVARAGAGARLVIPSPHHYPHLVSGQFNDALEAFMRAHEPA